MAPTRSAHHIGRRLGLQIGALLVTLLAVVGLLAFLLYENNEHDAADATLRETASTVTVDDAPPGFLVVVETAGVVRTSRPAPVGLPVERDLAAVRADGLARQREVELASGTFFVRTQQRGADVVQVAMDRTAAEDASQRLALALLVAGGIGVALAVGLAAYLARRALAPLTEALELQRRFVADASHELRTPLTLLSTRVQLMARRMRQAPDGEGSPPHAADLDGVLADTAALTGILDELLIAAEPQGPDQRVPRDLAALVESCAASAAATAEGRGVSLVCEVGEPVEVNLSEVAVRRAVTALVDNAIDHARTRVEVRVEVARRAVRVLVGDDGPGISPEAAEHVFDRFASSRPVVDRSAEGSASPGRRHYGLGLALVSDVATAHGGTVEVGSAADRSLSGATLVLTLPR